MVVGKPIEICVISAVELDVADLIFESAQVACIQEEVDGWPDLVIVQSLSLKYIRNFQLIMREVLRVEDKEQRHFFIASFYIEGTQSIESDIMITHTEDKGDQSIQFFVDGLKHVVDGIPTVVAAPHGIIVRDVSPQDYDVWLVFD